MSDRARSVGGGAISMGRLVGEHIPQVTLRWILEGAAVNLADLGWGSMLILYFFPGANAAGEFSPQRGEYCDPDSQFVGGFRDRHFDLVAREATVVGISSRPAGELSEFVQRTAVSSQILNDPELQVSLKLGLPTYREGNAHLYERLVLVAVRGQVRHVWYPIVPATAHSAADDVLGWLTRNA